MTEPDIVAELDHWIEHWISGGTTVAPQAMQRARDEIEYLRREQQRLTRNSIQDFDEAKAEILSLRWCIEDMEKEHAALRRDALEEAAQACDAEWRGAPDCAAAIRALKDAKHE